MYYLCLLTSYNKNDFSNLIQFDNIKKINNDYFITNLNNTNKTVKIYFFTSKYYWNIIKYNYQEYIIIDKNFKFCLYDYIQNIIIQNPSVGLWHTLKQNNFKKNNCEVNLTVKCNKLRYQRISDVLIKGIQLEFQNSMIDFDKIIIRTRDYLQFAKKVFWILNYTTNNNFFIKNNLYYINKNSLINSFLGIELIDEFKDMVILINYDDKLFYVDKDILTIIENFDKDIILCSEIKYCNEIDFYEIIKNNNDLIFKDLDSIFDNEIKNVNKTDNVSDSKPVSEPPNLINTAINNKITSKTRMYYAGSTLYDYNPNKKYDFSDKNKYYNKQYRQKSGYNKRYSKKTYYDDEDTDEDTDEDSDEDTDEDFDEDFDEDSDEENTYKHYNRGYNQNYYNRNYNNRYNQNYYNQNYYNRSYNNRYRKNYY